MLEALHAGHGLQQATQQQNVIELRIQQATQIGGLMETLATLHGLQQTTAGSSATPRRG